MIFTKGNAFFLEMQMPLGRTVRELKICLILPRAPLCGQIHSHSKQGEFPLNTVDTYCQKK